MNTTDVFIRLLSSIAIARIAPASFYSPDASGRGTRPHADGLSVGFAAEAIGALGSRNTTSRLAHNMVNPHDDGVSLDTFVDWMISAGLPIRRIEATAIDLRG
ncbi:hypothetical protein [Amycolatopsis sp. NPDC051102]|uniref:hypothetical protein n=1 Tax=Amycolatopsis sp. NPDC051102 TaxID=3155163 RepID=UPI003418DCD7